MSAHQLQKPGDRVWVIDAPYSLHCGTPKNGTDAAEEAAMSEYQYYEFQAIDRPLTKEEMAKIRTFSTRATITPTRFVNEYTWGDFKGDPRAMVEQYYDAFLYVANWGTHRFMLRLPRQLLAPEAAAPYFVAEGASVLETAEHLILEFLSEDEEREFDDDAEADGWLSSLLPLRSELAGGDLRALYLGWLYCVQAQILQEDEVEPPVPPGLKQLSASLDAFCDFLRIDQDLLTVAAALSADFREAPVATADLDRVIRQLPEDEKDALLIRAARGEAPQLRAELLQRAVPSNQRSACQPRTLPADGPLQSCSSARSNTPRPGIAANLSARRASESAVTRRRRDGAQRIWTVSSAEKMPSGARLRRSSSRGIQPTTMRPCALSSTFAIWAAEKGQGLPLQHGSPNCVAATRGSRPFSIASTEPGSEQERLSHSHVAHG
jgi:hypothetical protein